MKKISLFLLLIIFLHLPTSFVNTKSIARYTYSMNFLFENHGKKLYTLREEDVTIPLFGQSNWYSVKIINQSHTIKKETLDEDKNHVAILDMPLEIPPESSISFQILYEIESSGRPKPIIRRGESGLVEELPEELVNKYCIPSETFMSQHPDIIILSNELAKEENRTLDVILNLVEWFLDNTNYSNDEDPRYPTETLADMQGDCDDQAILLITMLRSLNIPAFLQVGIVISNKLQSSNTGWKGHLEISQEGVGWHGWAMVYINPWGWIPVDLTLLRRDNPLEMLSNAPEYQNYVIPVFNISKQDYVGENRVARDEIMNSELYIKMVDKAIIIDGSSSVPDIIMISIGILLGGAILVMFYMGRRR